MTESLSQESAGIENSGDINPQALQEIIAILNDHNTEISEDLLGLAENVQKNYGIPELLQDALKERIYFELAHRQIDSAIRLRDVFNIPNPELYSTVCAVITDHITEEGVNNALGIAKWFNLPQPLLTSLVENASVRDAIVREVTTSFVRGHQQSAERILNKFGISSETMDFLAEEIVANIVNEMFEGGRISAVYDLQQIPWVSTRVLRSARVQDAVCNSIKDRLPMDGSMVHRVGEILRLIPLLPEERNYSLAQELIISLLHKGYVDDYLSLVIMVQELVHLPDAVTQKEEFQALIIRTINLRLQASSFFDEISIRAVEIFHVPANRLQPVIEKCIELALNRDDSFEKLINQVNCLHADNIFYPLAVNWVSEKIEKFSSNEAIEKEHPVITKLKALRDKSGLSRGAFQTAVAKGLVVQVAQGRTETALFLTSSLDLDEETMKVVGKQSVSLALDRLNHSETFTGEKEWPEKIKRELGLSDEIFHNAIREKIIQEMIKNPSSDLIAEIVTKYQIEEQDVKSYSMEALVELIFKSHEPSHDFDEEEIDPVGELVSIYRPFRTPYDCYRWFSQNEEFYDIFRQVEENFPALAERCKMSADLTVSLCRSVSDVNLLIEELASNPFLITALEANPRFAAKLIAKYPRFDGISKDKIGAIFAVQGEVAEESPDVNTHSPEYRVLMQKHLLDYCRNRDILEACSRSGIAVENWLNYSNNGEFELGESTNEYNIATNLSSYISGIRDFLGKLPEATRHVLGRNDIKSTLLANSLEISLYDKENIEEQKEGINKNLRIARERGETQKVENLERALANLETIDLNKTKQIKIWDAILGNVEHTARMAKSIQDKFLRLEELEQQLRDNLNTANLQLTGQNLVEIKSAYNQAKDSLGKDARVAHKRIAALFKFIQEALLKICDEETAGNLVNEIKVASIKLQPFDYYNANIEEILNQTFGIAHDSDSSNKMIGRVMTAGLWNRDPNIDLYQGDYTSCCISVTGEIHGSESPIADYITDLGIQVFNIRDASRETAIPITAAWLWLGETKDGETALVVDNLEANTEYSIPFGEQLTSEILYWLVEYAKAVGVRKLVLGTRNNDVVNDQFIESYPAGKKYRKIGGTNERDEYYLEAEYDKVVVIWDRDKGLLEDATEDIYQNHEDWEHEEDEWDDE